MQKRGYTVVGEDHPHAYGDKSALRARLNRGTGSSPRVWGQEKKYCELYLNDRIIPTRMGTRKICLTRQAHSRDHPHAYGDKDTELLYMSASEGSSPRVWGHARLR